MATADIATNGEFFWPGDHAADAARALAMRGRFIAGGEVYRRRSIGWAAYLGEWTTSLGPPDAGWGEAIQLGLAEALSAIALDPAAWAEPDATPEDLRFFFASFAASDAGG